MTKLRHFLRNVVGRCPDRQAYAAIGMSTCVHVCLMAVLGLLLVDSIAEPPATAVVTEWATPDAGQSVDDPLPITLPATVTPPGGGTAGLAEWLAEALTAPAPQAALPVDVPGMTLAARPAEQAAAGVASSQPAAGGNSNLTGKGGTGNGSGAAKGDESGSAAFFGLNAPGKRFVFVVDASGSMNQPHPGEAKTRFIRVKLELLRTITQMTDQQQFFVIFFNDTPLAMPASYLVDATPAAQSRYLRWMVDVPAFGETEPEQALLLALRLRPDVVYFLTDGAFKYRVVREVAKANRSGVAIHTIGFGEDRGAQALQQIAAQNGGVYQFIPADESTDSPPVPTQQAAKP